MGAALILASLALLGGASLTDFALALLIDLAVGTYSSVFTAAPLAIAINHRTNPPQHLAKEDPDHQQVH
jgi:SecD/SecF fusion protein